MLVDVRAIKFAANGLVPAVVQAKTGEVLMLAYMNREALERTIASGETWFYSRSRQALWHKGETSGHFQKVLAITADCDGDALLVTVEQTGVACHTGERSCFHRPVAGEAQQIPAAVLAHLEAVLQSRRGADPATSYTASLLADLDRACKKVGEEATEVVLAVKNGDKANLAHEAADLLYHTLVLLVSQGLGLEAVAAELARRQKE